MIFILCTWLCEISYFFLLLLNCSAWPCLALFVYVLQCKAYTNKDESIPMRPLRVCYIIACALSLENSCSMKRIWDFHKFDAHLTISGFKKLTVETVPIDAGAPSDAAGLRGRHDGAVDEVGVVEAMHAVRVVVVVRRRRGRGWQRRGVRVGRGHGWRVLPLHEAAVQVHLADSQP